MQQSLMLLFTVHSLSRLAFKYAGQTASSLALVAEEAYAPVGMHVPLPVNPAVQCPCHMQACA